jgi:hypothetical protein
VGATVFLISNENGLRDLNVPKNGNTHRVAQTVAAVISDAQAATAVTGRPCLIEIASEFYRLRVQQQGEG